MATIHEIKIEPMTEESVAPFGEIRDTADRRGDHRVSSPTGDKYDGRTTEHVNLQPHDGFTFNEPQRHWGSPKALFSCPKFATTRKRK